MYQKLKKELKKKIDESNLIKILDLRDYTVLRSFLIRRSERLYRNIVDALGFQRLSRLGIKQGDLLISSERFLLMSFDMRKNRQERIQIQPKSFFVPISFIIIKNNKNKIPNITIWFKVLYNKKLYYLDANEFLRYIDIDYIIKYKLE